MVGTVVFQRRDYLLPLGLVHYCTVNCCSCKKNCWRPKNSKNAPLIFLLKTQRVLSLTDGPFPNVQRTAWPSETIFLVFQVQPIAALLLHPHPLAQVGEESLHDVTDVVCRCGSSVLAIVRITQSSSRTEQSRVRGRVGCSGDGRRPRRVQEASSCWHRGRRSGRN